MTIRVPKGQGTHTWYTANLWKNSPRHAREIVRQGSQAAIPWKDAFTVDASPSTTYVLTYLPIDKSVNFSLNGVELVEGDDYTVDPASGIINVTATIKGTPTPADVLTADYWTNNNLIAGTPSGGATTELSISGNTAVNVSAVDAVAFIDSGVAFSDIAGDLTPGSGDADLVFASCPPLAATENGSFLFLRCNPTLGGLWRFDRAGGVDTDTQIQAISALNSGGGFSVTASGSTLTIKQGATTIATVSLGTSDAALLSQTYVGIRESHGTGSSVDNFSAQGGTVTDDFNRSDSVTLGRATTGQFWLGNR